jgi:Tol biopolymer transport system component
LPHYSISSDSKNIFISYGGKIHRIELESCKDEIVPFSAKVNVDLGPYNYNTNSIGNDSIKVRYIRWARTSPDGKQLAFSALDRIYVVDLPAGKPRVLANQAANQFQPVYSSDSRWIAYVSWADTIGGYIWRVPSKGGLPERLANIPGRYFCPTWSPNGKWIAVLWEKPKIGNRDDLGLARLELVPADGGPIRTIDDSIPMLNNLCFSANGERIMYNPKRSIFRKLKAELISRDLNGLNQEIIAVGTDPTFFSAKEVSPDGRYIVYSNMENLYLATVSKGTGPTSLSDEDRRLSVVRFAAGIDPHWEKDGKVIAWNYGNRFYRISPEKIMDAVERLGQNGLLVDSPGRYFRTVSVLPEEVIDVPMTIPASYAQGMIALKNARIITMRKEKVIERGTVLVEDGRIVAVGPVASITIPAGTKSLNFSGTTIMPGLIDLHLHLHLAPDVLPEQSWVLLASLAYGVTTVRDPSLNYESYGYAELLKSGKMIGPRLYTVGRPVRFGDGIPRLDNLEDARAVVRNRLELGSIVVKNYLPAALRLKREWLAIACREAGLNMTNEGWNDPILAWGMIKDGSAGLEHNPFWGDVYKDIISIFVRSGIWFTPTIQVSESLERGLVYFNHKYWREPDAKLQRFTIATDSMTYEGSENETVAKIMNARPSDTSNPGFIASARIDARIRHAGGHVTLGSHGNDVGIGAHNELWALQLGGLTNMEALQAGTIMGAEALGVQKDLGSLEVGKIADLIILNKNPLDDIHNSREIRYVMKDGILYDANTLDENWPEKKKCPEWRMPEDRQPASQASLPTPPKTGSARD